MCVQIRINNEYEICHAIVDSALFLFCIFLLLATYWFSRMQYSYFLSIDPVSVAGAAGGGGGGEGAHVQLGDLPEADDSAGLGGGGALADNARP